MVRTAAKSLTDLTKDLGLTLNRGVQSGGRPEKVSNARWTCGKVAVCVDDLLRDAAVTRQEPGHSPPSHPRLRSDAVDLTPSTGGEPERLLQERPLPGQSEKHLIGDISLDV